MRSSLQQARARAEQALEIIRHGASFASIARSESEGPTADRGGEMGYFKAGKLAPALQEKLFRMAVAEVSDVIRTKQGFAIFQVTERQEKPLSSADLDVLTPGWAPLNRGVKAKGAAGLPPPPEIDQP